MNSMTFESPFIVVRLLVPADETVALYLPGCNRVATKILLRLLVARMEASGFHVLKSACGLPLNNSIYWFVLDTPDDGKAISIIYEAMSIIHGELVEVGLGPAAQVAFMDRREEIWRLGFPQSGVFVLPTPEELSADESFNQDGNHLRSLVEMLRHRKPEPE